MPSAWLYTSGEGPKDWPTAPLCRRCAEEREPGDTALRAFVATRIASADARAAWNEAPPRQVRDGIDRLVRGLHHVLLGECTPAATTVVMGEPPQGDRVGVGRPPSAMSGASADGGVESFEIGPGFRVQHLSVRLHHRWRITFVGTVTFCVVTCPPLSDALQSLSQEADRGGWGART